MILFDYVKPASFKNLLEEMAQAKSSGAILAGGTDLIVKLRGGLASRRVLFEVNDIEELNGIGEQGDFLRIGACTRIRNIAESALVKKFAPSLSLAASQLGSPQIRNRATVGGNIVSASPAADTVPPLMAGGAKVRLKGVHGERDMALEDFMVGPGKTAIRDDEVLIEIHVPKMKEGCRSHFLKVGRRRAMAISVVSFAGWVRESEDGIIEDVRIVLGSVAPTALRAKKTEHFLRGKACREDVLREAARMASTECRPILDIRATESGRRLLVEAWTYRLLQTLST